MDKTESKKEIPLEGSTVQEKQTEVSAGKDRTLRTPPKLNRSPLHGLWALTNRDLRKWYTNPIQLFVSLIQPIVWLGLFGKAMNFGAFLIQHNRTAFTEQQATSHSCHVECLLSSSSSLPRSAECQ